MDHDRLNLGNSLQDSNNEIEFVEIKMEPPEELDVCQMASEPNAASCNQVDSSIGDPTFLKEDKEQPQDNPDLLPTDFLILEHSVADHNDEPSENSVPSGVEQSVNKLEPEQPPSSPFHSCTKFGYRTIAVNQIIDEVASEPKGKKRKGEKNDVDIVPSPFVIDVPEELSGRLKVLNRLTVRLSDPSQFVKVSQSENLKKYHLLAVTPLNENAFQHLCHTLDVDIITLSPAEKNLRFNRKLYNLAVSKNMYFELSYGPALNSSANRRDLIQLSHALHGVGKSKNVIITSSATSYLQIRGPYEVMNLGLLFGLNQDQAKRAISNLPKDAIKKRDGLRFGKTVVTVLKIGTPEFDDGKNVDEITSNAKRLKKTNEILKST